MADVNIEDLFDNDRFPSGLGFLAVVVYFPFGVLLAVLRLFIGFHAFLAACFLPKMSRVRGVILRVMCSVLGIIVTQTDSHNRDKNARIFVANYTSTLDHLALGLIYPSVLPSVWDLPPTLMWMLGYSDMGAKKGRDILIQNARAHCQNSSIPLLAFPEGASTNGRKGLLKFSVWPFSLNHPVQPVIIEIRRPVFVRLSPSVLGGRWWMDVFWFLFVPYTCFHIRLLRSLEQQHEEGEEDFAHRCQRCLAESLQIQATSLTSADKVDYAKRKLIVSSQQPNVSQAGSRGAQSSEMDEMCLQVLQVLPQVPRQVILEDLALTKDVDLTISNLVEGRVQYEPLPVGVDAQPSPSTSPPQQHSLPPSRREFAKNPRERQMSFEERKRALIENARRRYLEKQAQSTS